MYQSEISLETSLPLYDRAASVFKGSKKNALAIFSLTKRSIWMSICLI